MHALFLHTCKSLYTVYTAIWRKKERTNQHAAAANTYPAHQQAARGGPCMRLPSLIFITQNLLQQFWHQRMKGKDRFFFIFFYFFFWNKEWPISNTTCSCSRIYCPHPHRPSRRKSRIPCLLAKPSEWHGQETSANDCERIAWSRISQHHLTTVHSFTRTTSALGSTQLLSWLLFLFFPPWVCGISMQYYASINCYRSHTGTRKSWYWQAEKARVWLHPEAESHRHNTAFLYQLPPCNYSSCAMQLPLINCYCRDRTM